jgi:putative IMPACT (imprinted ancient) family translation regulator
VFTSAHDLVLQMRRQLKVDVKKLSAGGISAGSQPFVWWRNGQVASTHRAYAGDVAADMKKLTDEVNDVAADLRLGVPYRQLRPLNDGEAAAGFERRKHRLQRRAASGGVRIRLFVRRRWAADSTTRLRHQ